MHATGPEPGPPPPCGVEKVLCRFRCITSTPKSPGRVLPHQRVHVGAVHVEQGALGVENVGDLVDLALEDADGAGVGQHQRGRVFGDDLLQLGHVDHAASELERRFSTW